MSFKHVTLDLWVTCIKKLTALMTARPGKCPMRRRYHFRRAIDRASASTEWLIGERWAVAWSSNRTSAPRGITQRLRNGTTEFVGGLAYSIQGGVGVYEVSECVADPTWSASRKKLHICNTQLSIDTYTWITLVMHYIEVTRNQLSYIRVIY